MRSYQKVRVAAALLFALYVQCDRRIRKLRNRGWLKSTASALSRSRAYRISHLTPMLFCSPFVTRRVPTAGKSNCVLSDRWEMGVTSRRRGLESAHQFS